MDSTIPEQMRAILLDAHHEDVFDAIRSLKSLTVRCQSHVVAKC